jgi:hypothetical protein
VAVGGLIVGVATTAAAVADGWGRGDGRADFVVGIGPVAVAVILARPEPVEHDTQVKRAPAASERAVLRVTLLADVTLSP